MGAGAAGGGGDTTSALLAAVAAAGDDGGGVAAGGGGTKAGGPPLLLTGADGAGIEPVDDDDDWGDISEWNWSADFDGVDGIEGRAAGAGGAPMDDGGFGLPLVLAMIEFKCIEDLLASEGSFSVGFLGTQDSISIVVSGPVPREHWNSTLLMMRATCWSRM